MTYEMFINFIGDDWDLVSLGQLQNGQEMIAAEDRAAGVGGIVDENRCRCVVDQRLQVIQVYLPVLLWLESGRKNVQHFMMTLKQIIQEKNS